MSTRHLGTRAGEHLNLDDSHKSAIKDHLRFCRQCCDGLCNVTSFIQLVASFSNTAFELHSDIFESNMRKIKI